MDCATSCQIEQPKQEVHQTVSHRYGIIDTMGLKNLINAKVPLVILDARTGQYDDGNRIPNAKALSYEATAEQASALIPSKESLVVVYCSNLKCPAGQALAEKLVDYGYLNVVKYAEGIQQWMASGNQVVAAK